VQNYKLHYTILIPSSPAPSDGVTIGVDTGRQWRGLDEERHGVAAEQGRRRNVEGEIEIRSGRGIGLG
jgi:hypothetical protein